jgi:hypothetical protein
MTPKQAGIARIKTFFIVEELCNTSGINGTPLHPE